MEFRSQLLCCACRLDLTPELGKPIALAEFTQFIVFIINQSIGYNIEILTKQEGQNGPGSLT